MTTTTWTSANGNSIKITFESAFELCSQGNRKTSGLKTVVTELYVDGVLKFVPEGITPVTHPVAVAKIGPVGINAENMAKLTAARAEIEAEIATHNAAIWANFEACEAVSRESLRIEKAMAF